MTTEIKKEIALMLDNIIYWDGCPDSYKERIPELIKELETTKPVNVDLADVSKCNCAACGKNIDTVLFCEVCDARELE